MDAQDSVCIILVNITQKLVCSIMAKFPQKISVTFLALVNTCCQQTVHTLASDGGIIAAIKQEA
jgi:predicted O-linked N-acetylglucosamine transferase (SPINDLY family)